MKKIIPCLFTLLVVATVHAVTLEDLAENPPEAGSPADIFIVYKKAAANEDIEQMRTLVAGMYVSTIENPDGFKSEVDLAKEIDWEKPIKWAQKIEGDSAKVAFQFISNTSGRRSFARMDFSKVDGAWKYGK